MMASYFAGLLFGFVFFAFGRRIVLKLRQLCCASLPLELAPRLSALAARAFHFPLADARCCPR